MLVVLPMAVLPVALIFELVAHPVVGQAVADLRSPEHRLFASLMLLAGVIVSVYGAHTLHTMRRATSKARQMGMYNVVKKLAAGGMGEVWIAEHRMLSRPAAIKVIRPEMLDSDPARAEQMIRRFEQEAQATAALRSPHTVELYEFGVTDEGIFYYVMEYLEGLDVDTLMLRHGPLPAERVVYLLGQACRSLAEAYSRGLIHRDIKPSNLYICAMGLEHDVVKVLDFGLVSAVESGSGDLGGAGQVAGTPAFMAPEMPLGRTVDERFDIYALGCVAYYLLTGLLVFDADTPTQFIVEHIKTEPEPPSRRSEMQIPEALEKVVMACLQKDPEQRPQSMQELRRLLEGAVTEPRWTEEAARQWWQVHHGTA